MSKTMRPSRRQRALDEMTAQRDQLLEACAAMVEQFSEWDAAEEEPETDEAAIARNNAVRAYWLGKAAVEACT